MLYYVKTGNLDVSLYANSPKHAALKTISSNEKSDLGICTIVSKKEINKTNQDEHLYFLTEDIISECNFMRLVG